MSAFDITLNVIGTSLGVPDEAQLKDGAPSEVEITLMLGQTLPFAQAPGGPPVTIPLGTVTYKLDRDTAMELFTKGQAAVETLPAKSKLEVASDLNAVEAAAERMRDITGGNDGGK